MKAQLVLNTCSSTSEAERIATALLEKKLAACVNIVPGVSSIYHWEGKIEKSSECLLLIKTSDAVLARLEEELHRLHSYDVPEFVVLEPSCLSPGYAAWLEGCCKEVER